jgi:hypothetical protein
VARSLRRAHAPLLLDCDTAGFAVATAAELDGVASRWSDVPHAQVLPLPLKPTYLASASNLQSFGDVVLDWELQHGAGMLVPGYFRFETRGDAWHRVDLELVAHAARREAPEPVAAFVTAPLASLLSGQVAATAVDYAQAGAGKAFLRICGFDPERADTAEIAAYRAAMDAFAQAGVEPVADCVGRFGLALCARGYGGFSSGAIHYKMIMSELVVEQDGGPRVKLGYEVPDGWYQTSIPQARKDLAAGLVPACPQPRCNALTAGTEPGVRQHLKEHLIHYFVRKARAVAAAGVQPTRASLQAQGQPRDDVRRPCSSSAAR